MRHSRGSFPLRYALIFMSPSLRTSQRAGCTSANVRVGAGTSRHGVTSRRNVSRASRVCWVL